MDSMITEWFLAKLFMLMYLWDSATQTQSAIYAFPLFGFIMLIVIISHVKRRHWPSKLVTEAGLVRQMSWEVRGTHSDQFYPTVTAPTEEISIRAYKDADESLDNYKTFDFDCTNKTNRLLEQELFGQLEKFLQARGMTRDKKNPQAVISMDFFIGRKDQYNPPTTVTSTEIKHEWNTGFIGWNVGGFTSAVPVTSSRTEPGYTLTTYYSNIRVNFLNHAKLAGSKKQKIPPLIWLGEAESEGCNPDIRGISHVMFDGLMELFSDNAAKSSNSYVRRFRYGGLGLGFSPADRRIICYVEPSSVAAEHNIKSGDILLKVNGENPYRAALKRDMPATSKSPYFKHVLSNRGKSEVELVIKSAQPGSFLRKFFKKRVTLKMKPRSEDRYLYVDLGGNPVQKNEELPK